MLRIKFPTKKLSGHICLSPWKVQRWGSKDCYVWNIIMYRNGKLDSLQGSMLSKILFILKNALNKSCWELNFLEKIQRAHASISPRSGSGGLQRWKCLKYYNVSKREIRLFTLLRSVANFQYCSLLEIL